MHSAARHYDLLASLLTLGREGALRERLVELADLQAGEAVLDVGCGTGSLAMAAARRVGSAGTVHAVDASPEMIEQARRKAARAGIDVTVQVAFADALPFPDASFDVVFSTLMLHHLPRPMRQRLASEVRRVLRPGGRVLAVDFAAPAHRQKGLIARLHRHGGVPLADIVALLDDAGLAVVEHGPVGVSDLQFALARAPGGDHDDRPRASARALGPIPLPRWVIPVLVIAVVALHAIVLGILRSGLALSIAASIVLVLVVAAAHLRHGGSLHGRPRGRSRD